MLGRRPGSQFKLSDKYGESTKKPRKLRGESEKATVGVEPTMSDLQSDALASWPRRQSIFAG